MRSVTSSKCGAPASRSRRRWCIELRPKSGPGSMGVTNSSSTTPSPLIASTQRWTTRSEVRRVPEDSTRATAQRCPSANPVETRLIDSR